MTPLRQLHDLKEFPPVVQEGILIRELMLALIGVEVTCRLEHMRSITCIVGCLRTRRSRRSPWKTVVSTERFVRCD